MAFREGAAQRVTNIYWPQTDVDPDVYETIYITSGMAGVDSGQVVTEPYTPARCVYQMDGGMVCYWRRKNIPGDPWRELWRAYAYECNFVGGSEGGGKHYDIIGMPTKYPPNNPRIGWRGYQPGFGYPGNRFPGGTTVEVDVYKGLTYYEPGGIAYTVWEYQEARSYDWTGHRIICWAGTFIPKQYTYEIKSYRRFDFDLGEWVDPVPTMELERLLI